MDVHLHYREAGRRSAACSVARQQRGLRLLRAPDSTSLALFPCPHIRHARPRRADVEAALRADTIKDVTSAPTGTAQVSASADKQC